MRFLGLCALLAALPALAEVKTYTIKGMTCQGCVDMITAEVCKLPGVTSCKVDIGKATLEAAKLDDEAVKKGIAKAGYEWVSTAEPSPAAKPKKTSKEK